MMDIELIKYMKSAAGAWDTWAKSKKTPADQLAFAAVVSAVPARAKILWAPVDSQVFQALATVALVGWQVILDSPAKVTAKQFAEALIRTAIAERSRSDFLEGTQNDYKDVWLVLSKVSAPALIYALVSGELTFDDVIDDVQDSAKKIAAAAPSVATGLIVGAVALLAIVVILK